MVSFNIRWICHLQWLQKSRYNSFKGESSFLSSLWKGAHSPNYALSRVRYLYAGDLASSLWYFFFYLQSKFLRGFFWPWNNNSSVMLSWTLQCFPWPIDYILRGFEVLMGDIAVLINIYQTFKIDDIGPSSSRFKSWEYISVWTDLKYFNYIGCCNQRK